MTEEKRIIEGNGLAVYISNGQLKMGHHATPMTKSEFMKTTIGLSHDDEELINLIGPDEFWNRYSKPMSKAENENQDSSDYRTGRFCSVRIEMKYNDVYFTFHDIDTGFIDKLTSLMNDTSDSKDTTLIDFGKLMYKGKHVDRCIINAKDIAVLLVTDE